MPIGRSEIVNSEMFASSIFSTSVTCGKSSNSANGTSTSHRCPFADEQVGRVWSETKKKADLPFEFGYSGSSVRKFDSILSL